MQTGFGLIPYDFEPEHTEEGMRQASESETERKSETVVAPTQCADVTVFLPIATVSDEKTCLQAQYIQADNSKFGGL